MSASSAAAPASTARAAGFGGLCRGKSRTGPSRALLLANAAGAVAATVFATAGVVRSDHSGASGGFWAASSAVRTLAITGPLLAGMAARGRPAPQLLIAAGLAQLGDSALGLWQHNLSMTVAPAAMGLIHLRTAWALTQRHPDARA